MRAAILDRLSFAYFAATSIAVFGLSILATAATAAPGDLMFKLTPPDWQAGAGFGETLAVMDGKIVVGEPNRHFPGLSFVGRAHLFDVRNGDLLLTFNDPEPRSSGTFGRSLAADEQSVFVGRRGRVYAIDSATGEVRLQIDAPSDGGSSFGSALAYGNGRLLVAEPSFTTNGLIAVGRAHLYNSTTGQLDRTILHPEPSNRQIFSGGYSLAVFGDKLAVGSFLYNDGDGRVWVFDRTSGETLFTLDNPHTVRSPPHFLSDWFGWNVAANENIIVVGAQEDDESGVAGSGTVYVFDSNTGALKHTLFSPQLEVNGEFGRSVAVTPQGHVLVGAWRTSVNGIEGAGHAYLFDGETGTLLLDIPNPEPEIGVFAWSVAATESAIIVGSPAAQAVYVFETIPEPSSLVLGATLFATALGIAVVRRSRRNAG